MKRQTAKGLNRLVLLAGVMVSTLGASAFFLLSQLQSETFREDLPFWFDVAILLAISGALVAMAGIALPRRELGMMDSARASRYFSYASLVNTVSASVFAAPVLIPSLEFPILLTRWPGIYMVIAFSLFVVIGILGSFAWSVLYVFMPQLSGGGRVYRPLLNFQFVTMEAGVYLLSIFMFWGGYVGSSLAYRGFGDTVVGSAMEFSVIPAALGISLLILSNLVGVANTVLSNRNARNGERGKTQRAPGEPARPS